MISNLYKTIANVNSLAKNASIAVALTFAMPAAAQTTGTVTPYATSPQQGETLYLSEPLKLITISFPGLGEDGIGSFRRSEDLSLEIMKDGALWQSIPSTDRDAIKIGRNDPEVMEIYTAGIVDPGTYSITIPNGFVQMSTLTGGAVDPSQTEEDPDKPIDMSKFLNAEFTLSFTVKDMIRFSLTPAPGTVKTTDLAVITVTYPEGAVVSAPDAYQQRPTLYYVDMTITDGDEVINPDGTTSVLYQRTLLTYYQVSYPGDNTVILTASNPDKIKATGPNTVVTWETLNIPNGAWKVTLGDRTETVPYLVFEKYKVESDAPVVASDVPTLVVGQGDILNAEDFAQIALTLPEGYKLNEYAPMNPLGKRVGKDIVAYLRHTADAEAESGTQVATYTISSVESDRIVLNCSSSLTDLPSGYYCVYLPGNLLVLPDGKKSSPLYFKGYLLSGLISGVNALPADSNVAHLYYDLQGVCLGSERPAAPGLYIRKTADRAQKILIK